MQQDDYPIMHEEERSCSPGGQPRTNLPETIPEKIHERQPQRPAILHCLDVTADLFAFAFRQSLQPFPHWLIASGSAVEGAR